MSFLVGIVASEQPTMLLTSDGHAAIDLSNYYIYQRADVFQKVVFAGTTRATLSNPVPGIMLYAVFEQNGTRLFTISSKSEREKVLALLP